MKKTILAGSLAAMVCAFATPATAAVVFTDDFTRNGDTVGNGWAEINLDPNDVFITGSALRLRDIAAGASGTVASPDAAATHSISTLGYNNIAVQYSWKKANGTSEDSDHLFASWKLSSSSSWNPLLDSPLGGINSFATTGLLSLGAEASNSNIDFRFWTNVGDGNEGALIDWVTISGDEIVSAQATVNAIPEPASLALLGLGLIGLGATRRRKTAA